PEDDARRRQADAAGPRRRPRARGRRHLQRRGPHQPPLRRLVLPVLPQVRRLLRRQRGRRGKGVMLSTVGMTMSPRWHAVGVHARQEKAAAVELERRGFEVFLPVTSERRIWSDRIREVEQALFPGYLFLRT